MLRTGKFYQVKFDNWLVFPTKEVLERFKLQKMDSAHSASLYMVDYWTNTLKCAIPYLPMSSCFLVTDIEGKFAHVVGQQVGWIMSQHAWYEDLFEELSPDL